ncbi:MAG: hypothetical protein ABR587_08820 [Candidatus Binatia bacterium]
MNALGRASAALAGFLRGFLGIVRRSDGFADALDAHRVHSACHDAEVTAPTPSSVREALAARAATRGNCC